MRERQTYYIHPLDFEGDVGIGLTLPLSNDPAALSKYDVEENGIRHSNALGAPYIGTVPATSPPYVPMPTGSFNKNMVFSPSVKVQGGFHVSYTTQEQAKSNLKNLVLTNRYERPFNPELGCHLTGRLFDPMSHATTMRIKEDIESTINNFEPRVNLTEIAVEAKEQENGYLIFISFFIIGEDVERQTTFFLERSR